MRIRRIVVPLFGGDVEKLEALVAAEESAAKAALGPHETPRPIDEHGHLVGQAETVRRLIRRAASKVKEVDHGE